MIFSPNARVARVGRHWRAGIEKDEERASIILILENFLAIFLQYRVRKTAPGVIEGLFLDCFFLSLS